MKYLYPISVKHHAINFIGDKRWFDGERSVPNMIRDIQTNDFFKAPLYQWGMNAFSNRWNISGKNCPQPNYIRCEWGYFVSKPDIRYL